MPTLDLYDFKGAISLNHHDASKDSEVPEELLGAQFIPRGSTIKATGEISAIAVYVGQETKVMQNLGSYKFKRSASEKRIFTTYIVNLLCLVSFVLMGFSWNYKATKDIYETHYYISNGETDTTERSVLSIFSFYLLWNPIIPLDMAVMIEFNAIFYSGFLVADAKMTHLNKDMGRIDSPKTNTLNLLENLAEVEYIMSDKTGTLTQNELTLVAVCCDASRSNLWGKTTA